MPQTFFHADPMSRIREDAATLAEESRACQTQLSALAATAGHDMEAAKTDLIHTLGVTASPIGEVRSILRDQLQRSIANARSVRRLLRGARRQHVAAIRLLSHLGDHRCREDDRHPSPCQEAVLVVDAHEAIREVARWVLEQAGFVVRTAGNGLEALIVAHEMRPAVVVMDVALPILDGLEATRLLKAAEATRHARVIAHTANPLATDTAPDALFVAVLHKPAQPHVMVETVRHVAGL